MEKTHRSQLTGLNSDIDELRLQYEYVGENISLQSVTIWLGKMQNVCRTTCENDSFAFVML